MSDVLPSSAAPPRPILSRPVRVALFLALAAFFCVVLVRLIALVAFAGVVLGAMAESPLLRAVGAVDEDLPKAMALGFVIPSLVVAGALAWRLVLWLRDKATKRSPSKVPWYGSRLYGYFAAWLAYMLLLRLPLDVERIIDADDALLGAALLSVVVFVVLVGSWHAVRLAIWMVRSTWVASQMRPVLAGMVVASATLVSGLAVGLPIAAHELIPDQSNSASSICAEDSVSCGRILVAAAIVGGGGGESNAKGSSPSGSIGGGSFGGGSSGGGHDPDACARKFLVPGGECRPAYRKGESVVRRRAPPYADVEQVLLDSVLITCRAPRDEECPYFIVVARRQAKKVGRRGAVDGETCDIDAVEAPPWRPEDRYYYRECAEAVARRICALDETKQAVVTLRIDGNSYEEIGAALGKSKEAVTKVFARAVAQLQEDLPPACL